MNATIHPAVYSEHAELRAVGEYVTSAREAQVKAADYFRFSDDPRVDHVFNRAFLYVLNVGYAKENADWEVTGRFPTMSGVGHE